MALRQDIFLNISKAFDKVWYKSLLLKLKQNGISDNLFCIRENK